MDYVDIKEHIMYRLYVSNRKAKILANRFIKHGWYLKQYSPNYFDLEKFLQNELGKKYFKLLKPVIYTSPANSLINNEIVECEYVDMSDEEFEEVVINE